MQRYRLAWFGSALVVLAALSACSKKDTGPDPAAANLAPADQYGQPLTQGQLQPPVEAPAQQPAYGSAYQTVDYAPAPPPPLPQYDQPECPGPGYIWTPGYWSYSEAGYYWVPGAWVMAPYVGALWTPPYWSYADGRYAFHRGYWGRHIGFYGGINYGFGYTGFGYDGGYWNNGAFYYNRAVDHVSPGIVHNVYDHSVTTYTPFNRIAYNGGPGGIARRPDPPEVAAARESHVGPVPAQIEHMRTAAADRGQFAGENHGRPATVAVQRPLAAANHAAPANPQSAGPAQRFGQGERFGQNEGRGHAYEPPTPGSVRQPQPAPRDQQAVRGQPAPRPEQFPRAMQAQHPQPAPANSADRRMIEERPAAPAAPRPSPFEMRRGAPAAAQPPAAQPRRESRGPAPQPRAMQESRPAPMPQQVHAPPPQPREAPQSRPQPAPVARPAQPMPAAPQPHAAPAPRPAPPAAQPHPEPQHEDHPGRGGR